MITNHCHPHNPFNPPYYTPYFQPFIDPYQYAAPIVWSVPVTEKMPHKCPVCKGRGQMPAGFYEVGGIDGAKRVACRSCAGNGLVWEPKVEG